MIHHQTRNQCRIDHIIYPFNKHIAIRIQQGTASNSSYFHANFHFCKKHLNIFASSLPIAMLSTLEQELQGRQFRQKTEQLPKMQAT